MSVTKPSVEIHSVDVQEPEKFTASFVYNYFVKDEAVVASSGLTTFFQDKPGEFYDAKVIDYLGTRLPRYTLLNWKPCVEESAALDSIPKNYIANNLSKVLSEEHFSSEAFTSLNITDQSIEAKLNAYVSSSLDILKATSSNSNVKTASISSKLKSVFLDSNTIPVTRTVTVPTIGITTAKREAIASAKDLNFSIQVSNSVVDDVVKKAVGFPESTYQEMYRGLYEISRLVQDTNVVNSKDFDSSDYVHTTSNYVSLLNAKFATKEVYASKIVGYIIERSELTSNGSYKVLEPIIVDNPNSSLTVDAKVKYYGKYRYKIRAVAEVSIPCVIEDTSEFIVSKFLIASRPTVTRDVNCIEEVPPPPPVDVKFIWDWNKDRLVVTWNFPTNAQRDIKQFQVFKRSTLAEPFTLVKQYSFDDSSVPGIYLENPNASCVEYVSSPKSFYLDEEFTKTSQCIYAIGCVDAHGMVSTYSAQYGVSFDVYKNKLIVSQISSSGAPRPYPNMNVSAEVFLDSVYESRKTKMTLSFDASTMELTNSEQTDLEFIKTKQSGAKYKILAVNTDLAISKEITVSIDDMRPTKDSQRPIAAYGIPDYGNRPIKGSSS